MRQSRKAGLLTGYVVWDKYACEVSGGYSIGGKLGTVRAANGEYPDADNGYTYITTAYRTEGTFTIMRSSSNDYYAYLKV